MFIRDSSSGILFLVRQPACDPVDIILFFDDLTGLRKIDIIILCKIRYPVIHRHIDVYKRQVMNRAAARSYPFQVIRKFMFNRPGEVFYIGGNDILPAPLSAEREAEVIEMLGTEKEKEGKSVLIEHNLRLVVYIAKKFDNTGVGVEDLISIGTIGLIKAINTFDPVKNIKLATYASRCIENDILMYLMRNSKTKMEVSIDEPRNVD